MRPAPTPSSSTIRMRGAARRDARRGRRAAGDRRCADWPIACGRQLAVGPHQPAAGAAFCAASSSTAPSRLQRREHRSRTALDDAPGCSPRSSWWRCRRSSSAAIFRAASARSAVSSTMPATLPAPTPNAGVPLRVGGAHVGLRAGGDDQVALAHQLGGRLLGDRRRQHLHQVARRADPVELRVDVLEQPRRRWSSPWATARRSPRCGPSSALMILLAGVAAGLVDGVIAQTTPTGRAISTMPRAGSSAMTPTVCAPAGRAAGRASCGGSCGSCRRRCRCRCRATASSASARLRAGSMIAQPAAATSSSMRAWS